NVNDAVEYILNKLFSSFEEWENQVSNLANLVTTSTKSAPAISSNCKSCEFRIDQNKYPYKKSGFNECWTSAGVPENKLSEPLVFDIWNFRKGQSLIDDNRFFIAEVEESDINPKDNDEPGLTSSQRQWL